MQFGIVLQARAHDQSAGLLNPIRGRSQILEALEEGMPAFHVHDAGFGLGDGFPGPAGFLQGVASYGRFPGAGLIQGLPGPLQKKAVFFLVGLLCQLHGQPVQGLPDISLVGRQKRVLVIDLEELQNALQRFHGFLRSSLGIVDRVANIAQLGKKAIVVAFLAVGEIAVKSLQENDGVGEVALLVKRLGFLETTDLGFRPASFGEPDAPGQPAGQDHEEQGDEPTHTAARRRVSGEC